MIHFKEFTLLSNLLEKTHFLPDKTGASSKIVLQVYSDHPKFFRRGEYLINLWKM